MERDYKHYYFIIRGEYSACIVSVYSELEYQLSLHYIEPYSKEFEVSHFRLSQYLKDNLYDEFPFAKEFVALRNKIVHQKYVATEEEALEFMDFAKTIFENARRK